MKTLIYLALYAMPHIVESFPKSSKVVKFGTPALRMKSDPTEVTPTNTFAYIGLSHELQQAAFKQNWYAPTNVQAKAIPAILFKQSRHVCIEAFTGSGKTGSYILPIVQLLLKQKQEEMSMYGKHRKVVRALILVPTRELCIQISEVLDTVAAKVKCSSAAIYGGVPIEPQMLLFSSLFLDKNEENFPDIIVATPGRLVDILNRFDDDPNDLVLERKLVDALDRKNRGRDDATVRLKQIEDEKLDKRNDFGDINLGKTLLKDVKTLVLDEADRLLGVGFEDEMNAVFDLLKRDSVESGEIHVRKLLVSATFPQSIKPRLSKLLRTSKDSEENEGSSNTDGSEGTIYISCESDDDQEDGQENDATSKVSSKGPPSTIIQRIIRLEEASRTQALRYLVETSDQDEWSRVLVFVATRYTSELVAKKLRRVGITALELHGKLDQESRAKRLQKFRRGNTQVLVATDLASRGLDIEGLPVVVNYDLPRSPADFTHRIGRTGRAGRSGIAISFVTPENEAHFNLIEHRVLRARLFKEVLPNFAPNEDKWAQQVQYSKESLPGIEHSKKGLAHDKMHGGIKGKRKSKKDKLRAAGATAAKEAATATSSEERLYS